MDSLKAVRTRSLNQPCSPKWKNRTEKLAITIVGTMATTLNSITSLTCNLDPASWRRWLAISSTTR